MSRSQGSPLRADLVRDPFPNAQPEGSEAELISAQRAAAVLLAVAQALTGWGSYERASECLLRDLAGALGLSAGALWLRSGDSLVAGAIWCPDDSERAALHSARNFSPQRHCAGSARRRNSSGASSRPSHFSSLSGADGLARAARQTRCDRRAKFLHWNERCSW